MLDELDLGHIPLGMIEIQGQIHLSQPASRPSMGAPMLDQPLRRLPDLFVGAMMEQGPGASLFKLARIYPAVLHRPADGKSRLYKKALFEGAVMVNEHGWSADGSSTGLAQGLKECKGLGPVFDHGLDAGHLHGLDLLMNGVLFAHVTPFTESDGWISCSPSKTRSSGPWTHTIIYEWRRPRIGHLGNLCLAGCMIPEWAHAVSDFCAKVYPPLWR